MMSVTLQNDRPQRKQLSDELDRLDGILDGLADGFQDAITDAVREGSRLAVKDAIIEILSNPELKATIQGTPGDEHGSAPNRFLPVGSELIPVGSGQGDPSSDKVGCRRGDAEDADIRDG
jgi:hypothetical protein